MAQDDNLHEVKSRKGLYLMISQTVKKSTKSVPASTAVKLPPKAVLTHNFFTPLRTNDMGMETTGAGGLQKIR
jgi:hypothetical protein